MTTELYKKYRPTSLKKMIGQLETRKTLDKMVKEKRLPHFLLFQGPTGCGKTTITRCLQTALDCSDRDYNEINGSEHRGIDAVRSIIKKMDFMPIGGKTRIWTIDEAHQLTKDAQNALLKPTEDTPEHTYFFFCTTDPQGLISALLGRCTVFALNALPDDDVSKLLRRVAGLEEIELEDELEQTIIECCDGSARKALVFLDAVRHLDNLEEKLKLVQKTNVKRQAIELARLLLKTNTKWRQVTAIIKELQAQEDPESVRHCVLGYMNSCLLSGNEAIMHRAFQVIEAFRDNWYDCKKAGLSAACYEILTGE